MDLKRWTFWDWGTVDHNPVKEWYDGLPEGAKDGLDDLLKLNSNVGLPREWLGFKFMQGELKNEKIWQLSFPYNNIQNRALGIFGNARKQAIILIGYIHKGKIYTPKSALIMAVSRAKSFRTGKGGLKLYERKIREDF